MQNIALDSMHLTPLRNVRPPSPSMTVFVGQLLPSVPDGLMKSVLELCGPICSWKRAVDPVSNVPKSFAFCEFLQPEGLLRALRLLHQLSIHGQEITIKVDQKTQQFLEQFIDNKRQKRILDSDWPPGVDMPNATSNYKEDGFGIIEDEDRKMDQCVKEKIICLIEQSVKLQERTTKLNDNCDPENIKTVKWYDHEIEQYRKHIQGIEITESIYMHYEILWNEREEAKLKQRKQEEMKDVNLTVNRQILIKHEEMINGKYKNEEVQMKDDKHPVSGFKSVSCDKPELFPNPSKETLGFQLKSSSKIECSGYGIHEKVGKCKDEGVQKKGGGRLEKLGFQLKSPSKAMQQPPKISSNAEVESDAAMSERGEMSEQDKRNVFLDLSRERVIIKLKPPAKPKCFGLSALDYKTSVDAIVSNIKEEWSNKMQAMSSEKEGQAEVHVYKSSEKDEFKVDYSTKGKETDYFLSSGFSLPQDTTPETEERASGKPKDEQKADEVKEKYTQQITGLFFSDAKDEIVTAPSDDSKAFANSVDKKCFTSPMAVHAIVTNDKDGRSNKIEGMDSENFKGTQKVTNLKKLIDILPSTKEELFNSTVDWSSFDKHCLHDRIRPWVSRKMEEFIGDEEATVVDFIVSCVRKHMSPTHLLELLVHIFCEEAELFVMKLWKMILYELSKIELAAECNTELLDLVNDCNVVMHDTRIDVININVEK